MQNSYFGYQSKDDFAWPPDLGLVLSFDLIKIVTGIGGIKGGDSYRPGLARSTKRLSSETCKKWSS